LDIRDSSAINLQEATMVQQTFSKDTDNNVFSRVKVGMEVYDVQDRRIGKIEDIYFGASSPEANERGTGAATAPDRGPVEDRFYQDIVRAFAADEIPEELQQRLLREGYIRIGGEGIFSTARYVLPDQVSSVTGDRVVLRTTRDRLIKR
jgi:hypothetical protein